MASKSIYLLKERKRIKDWLDEMKIQNYTINDDLTVDVVYGNVNLESKGLTEIPVQFGIVSGWFNVDNNHLSSTKGWPSKCYLLFCRWNDVKFYKRDLKKVIKYESARTF